MYASFTAPYMHRTTILLSQELRREAEIIARRRGITLSELIRRQLNAAIKEPKSRQRSGDPLFHPAQLMSADCPSDLAQNHDEDLYGATVKNGRE